MIWSNKKHTMKAKEMPFGTLNCIELGESGRGRKLLVLPSEVDIQEGLNPMVTIGLSKTGKPRVNRFKDNELYLLLDTGYGYTRRGDGRVWTLKENEESFQVLAGGYGADGDAGRIGNWDVLVLKVQKDFTGFFRVVLSGGNPSKLYRIENEKIYYCGQNMDNQLSAYTDQTGVEIPFYNYQTEDFGQEWKPFKVV